MRTLYSCPVVSSIFFYLSFFSLPNLSRHRLDVCHNSTHGVALVQISDAGLKRAARSSLKVQDAKNRHLGTVAQLCRAISSQLRHTSTIGKKLVRHQYLPHVSSQYGELRFIFVLCITVCCMHDCLGLYHGEVDLVGLKPILRNTTSFSALTLLVGSFDPQKPSPKWPIMCLVGR